MPTITFDAPEKLAQKVANLPEAKRDAWLTEVVEDAFDDEETSDSGLSEADHAAIKRGLMDLDAGRIVDSDTFFADLYAKVGLPQPSPFLEAVEKERERIKATRTIGQSNKRMPVSLTRHRRA